MLHFFILHGMSFIEGIWKYNLKENNSLFVWLNSLQHFHHQLRCRNSSILLVNFFGSYFNERKIVSTYLSMGAHNNVFRISIFYLEFTLLQVLISYRWFQILCLQALENPNDELIGKVQTLIFQFIARPSLYLPHNKGEKEKIKCVNFVCFASLHFQRASLLKCCTLDR